MDKGKIYVLLAQLCLTLEPHGLRPAKLLLSMGFWRKSYEVSWHSLLQGILLTQELNPGLLLCRKILYHLSNQGRTRKTMSDTNFNHQKKKINFCNDKYLNTQRKYFIFSSFLFSRSVVFDHVRPHEPQHPRLPCPTPTPGAYPNSCLLSQWCHPTISPFAIPFFSCPQYFPASESFQVSQLFTSDGQNTGISASTSVLPMNTQDWSPLAWTGWISLQSKGLSRVFSTMIKWALSRGCKDSSISANQSM